ncbi:MAG: hypothetical protein ACTHNQ_02710 [Microbacterium sp.]|uniref:hypothetical protein n=1 Tax=Microbacterium sp. TaxID=51671 RepID=UPI003F7E3127
MSLTSYGQRLQSVHLTIESIGRGSSRPARLIVWTDPDVSDGDLPENLKRLRTRGLEILPSPAAFGPHTKYFPYVVSDRDTELPLVTADDDSLYPRTWLERLQRAASRTPHAIVCYRAHRVVLESPAKLAPYNSWPPVSGTEPSALNFATGVSGVLYPPEFLAELQHAGERFIDVTPKADDVWLHYQAVIHGRLVRQIRRRPVKFPEIASTQEVALHRTNTARNANDQQIGHTYDPKSLSMLRQAARSAE